MAPTKQKIKLTKKQRGFVKDYLDTGNGTQAALKNYDTIDYNVANVIAVENLQKPTIRQALENHAQEAESMIYKLSQGAENEGVRLGASKDILDRAGYGATVKTQNTNVNIEITPESLEIAKKYEAELKKGL